MAKAIPTKNEDIIETTVVQCPTGATVHIRSKSTEGEFIAPFIVFGDAISIPFPDKCVLVFRFTDDCTINIIGSDIPD